MRRSRKALRAIAAAFAILLGSLAISASAKAIIRVIESRRYPAPGALVEVGGGRMHVCAEGRGPRDVVLLSGWGSPCPTYDFMPLIRALRDKYRVVVVDYFGYGWSDGTSRPRTSETIVEETRAAPSYTSSPASPATQRSTTPKPTGPSSTPCSAESRPTPPSRPSPTSATRTGDSCSIRNSPPPSRS